MISVATLIAAGIEPTQARIFAGPLAAACQYAEIDSAERIAGFVGQCRVESTDFTRLEENLRYRSPMRLMQVFHSRVKSLADASMLIAAGPQAIANRVYASKNGNDDEASGDGWKFRGRGLKQLTGRANYAEAAHELGRPYDLFPDLVAQPEDACLTAAWFWRARGCNQMADERRWDAITRAVNGSAMLQADLRRQYSEEALEAFA